MDHVTSGFLKAAGIGGFVQKALDKATSFLGRDRVPITMKLRPKGGVPAPRMPSQTPPKLQMLGGNASVSTPARAATPQQMMNTRIRSEMKRGL